MVDYLFTPFATLIAMVAGGALVYARRLPLRLTQGEQLLDELQEFVGECEEALKEGIIIP